MAFNMQLKSKFEAQTVLVGEARVAIRSVIAAKPNRNHEYDLDYVG